MKDVFNSTLDTDTAHIGVAVFPVFSQAALTEYCTPHGGKSLKHRQFSVVLPDLNCIYLESWDDTNHFMFTDASAKGTIEQWVKASGLYVLTHA